MPERYDYALAAALVVMDQLDEKPDQPKPERLAMIIFAMLHGMERYEEDRPKIRQELSAN
jgi:hypothetical protein